MDLKEFIEKFAEQFDETDKSEFKVDTVFKDLDEWSSLSALTIIAMADSEYDVRINGDDIRKSTTIEDLFNIMEDKKAK